jgi:hypothetical protein
MQEHINDQSNTIINEIILQVLKVNTERFGTTSYDVNEVAFDYLNVLDDATQLNRDEIESIARDIISKHKKENQSYAPFLTVRPKPKRKIKQHLSIDSILIRLSILLIIIVLVNVKINASVDTVSSTYALDNTDIVVAISPIHTKNT